MRLEGTVLALLGLSDHDHIRCDFSSSTADHKVSKKARQLVVLANEPVTLRLAQSG